MATGVNKSPRQLYGSASCPRIVQGDRGGDFRRITCVIPNKNLYLHYLNISNMELIFIISTIIAIITIPMNRIFMIRLAWFLLVSLLTPLIGIPVYLLLFGKE